MANIYFQVLKHHADAIQRMYGVKWVPQPHHFKLCKQLFVSEVEGFEPYTPEEVMARLDAYYREDWWKNVKHDFSNFCKHFDKFIPPKAESVVSKKRAEEIRRRGPMCECRECGKVHGAYESCPTNALRLAQ